MKVLKYFVPVTIRGQITVIIVFALLTVIIAGRALERRVKDYALPDMENIAVQADTVAALLRFSGSVEREAILAKARLAGWDVTLKPMATKLEFKDSPDVQNNVGAFVDLFFPPDDVAAPVGGWRTFLDGRRIIASKVDEDTLLILTGFPNSILTSSILSQGSYYFVAAIVLVAFFFIFAIRAITAPIQRIAEAANESDIANSSHIFNERGSVEIVALSKALNGMRSRIRVMVDSRTRMLRGIGHDLRTPLTRLRLRTERMDEAPLRDAMLSDIVRIDSLLTESLNYLKDEYATEPMRRVDISSILQTVCAEFSDIGFQVRYEGLPRLIVNCKPLAMMRAVTNLCDNGVKFGNSVTVRLQDGKSSFKIFVCDNGPGIADELRTRVFEPFFKADSARGGNKGGFGLGLSIVADIVKAHGGSIELSENSPQGLIARMDLPKRAIVPAVMVPSRN